MAVAARVVWDALCQLEVTLKRPLPDAAPDWFNDHTAKQAAAWVSEVSA